MGKVWKPVSGNMYGNLEVTPEGRIYVAYYNGIDQLSTMDSECPADLRLCRLVPDEGGVQPICAKCNDYLEPPSYCETCYDTAVNAWREAEAASAQRGVSVPVEVVETVVRWSELLHALVMDLRAHNVDAANLLRMEIDTMLAWAQQQKGGE